MTLIVNAFRANAALVPANGVIVPICPLDGRSNRSYLTDAIDAVTGRKVLSQAPKVGTSRGRVDYVQLSGNRPVCGNAIFMIDYLDTPLWKLIFDGLAGIDLQLPYMGHVNVPLLRADDHFIDSESADSQAGDMVRAAGMLITHASARTKHLDRYRMGGLIRNLRVLNLILPEEDTDILLSVLHSKLGVLKETLRRQKFTEITDDNPNGDWQINCIK